MVWILSQYLFSQRAKLRHWKDLFSYGVGLTLVRFYNFVSGFGIILIIGKLIGTEQTGVYDRSYRITNIPVRYLGDMIQKIMMPFMVKINDQEDKLYAFLQGHVFVKRIACADKRVCHCILPADCNNTPRA